MPGLGHSSEKNKSGQSCRREEQRDVKVTDADLVPATRTARGHTAPHTLSNLHLKMLKPTSGARVASTDQPEDHYLIKGTYGGLWTTLLTRKSLNSLSACSTSPALAQGSWTCWLMLLSSDWPWKAGGEFWIDQRQLNLTNTLPFNAGYEFILHILKCNDATV